MNRTGLLVVATANGWSLIPDTDTHINRMVIRSESSPRLYTVSQTRKSGIWQCECLGYRGNKSFDAQGRRSCKHLRTMLPIIEGILANPAKPEQSRPAPRPAPASPKARPQPPHDAPKHLALAPTPRELEFLAWYQEHQPNEAELARLIAVARRQRAA